MSIRNDEENKFLMRAPMTELDEQIIRTSIENPLGLSDDDLRSWMCIQKRMENERIYEALR
ncbi:hypothetical protein BDN70DRAFT_871805 [Pholiota conissans]|uniref:DUF8205 domain-containing protein n=1 Tax=Pholiota conissans TaxID=109636 RepID=A0A9P5ZFT3_9AGAR|nr:hypothetical protein BDN70DRAFT_871805 [Pholiota conissans]